MPVAVAPLLGDRPALDEPDVERPHGSDALAVDSRDVPVGERTLDLAQPPSGSDVAGTATSQQMTTAPTLGVPVSPSTEPSRRSGLGAPLHDLPPTAASLDAASLAANYARRPRTTAGNPAAQIPLALAAATRPQVAAGAVPLPAAPRPASPAAARPPTYAETSSLPLVSPEPERVGAAEPGLSSSLPPVPGATVAITPFHPMAPVVSARGAPDASKALGTDPAAHREGAALKAVIGRRHGVNLDDVTVDRSPAAAAKAQAMGADAYTHENTVVIPQSFGTVDAGAGQALLAHELTHAAQQRKVGPRALPSEHSPAGRTMEAEAISTELSYVAPGLSMSRVAAPPLPSPTGAAPGPGQSPSQPGIGALPLARSEPASIDDAVLTAALLRLGAAAGRPGASLTESAVGAPQTSAFGEAAVGGVPSTAPAPTPAAPVQQAWRFRSPFTTKPKGGAATPTVNPFSSRPSDSDLAQLASWLYPLISFKIRRELKTDRERAGLLTDLYRR